MRNKKYIVASVKKYLSMLMLFFVLLILNNCGGGGGGGNSSVLDLMSANDVEVTTLNDLTGLILSDVFVSISEVGKEQVILKSANTGDSGVYVFAKVKIGSYTVKVSKSGYESTTANVVVTNGPQKITIRLKPSFPPDSISGIVKRSDTLVGIADVSVEIKDSSPVIKTLSDKNGNYVLSNVQPTGSGAAPYVIKATKNGFQPAEISNITKLPNIAKKDVDITMQSLGSAEVLLPGKIIGVVKNRNTAEPVENINVTLQDSGLPSDFSRATGYYHIENVQAGTTYILTAIETTTSKKYKAYSQQIILSSEQTLVQDIMMEPVEEVAAPDYGWIIGTVYDSVLKSGLAGVSVELLGTTLYDVTKANGSFRVANITPNAEYIMLFSKSGYVSQTSKRTVQKNENNLDPVYMVPTSSSQNYCSIIGVVRDKDTKVAVAGMNVELSVPDTNSVTFTKISTTTSSSGAFVFEKVFIPNDKVESGQKMTMVVSRNDYVSLTIQVSVKGGIVNQIDETSTEVTKLKGTIMGTVVDADTNIPIAGANVSLANFTYPSVSNPITSVAGTGYFQFVNIPVGTYTILVSANDYATEVKNGITLTYNGQTIGPITVQLKKDYGTISGFVYLETNGTKGYQSGAGGDTPLSGITVSATSGAADALAGDISKSDGSYSLKNLSLANISILANSGASLNANYSSYSESYKVSKGYQTFNIELSQTKGNISGIIFEDSNKNGSFDNEPLIAGASVTVNQNGVAITTTSDAQGTFVLTGLNFGTINMSASKSNYKDSSKTVMLPQNGSLSNINIGLYKPTGKLTGRVVDNTGGVTNPPGINGVTVKILGFSNLSTTTDSTGGYIFNEVLASTGGIAQYTVVADGSSLGYAVVTKTATAPEEGAIASVEDIELTKTTRLVYGKIIDSVTLAGISNVKVKIQGTSLEADTDRSGIYVFSAVPVNTALNYTLGISDTINVNGSPRYQNRDDVSISVNNDSTPLKVQDIPVTPNMGKVHGTVYDSITGYPIKSTLFQDTIQAELTIPGVATVIAGVSQVNGEFLVENVPGGSYNLKVRHAASGTNVSMFDEVSRTALVTAGQTTDLGIIYVTLKTVIVKGTVKDRIVANYKLSNPSTPDYFISGAQVQAKIDGIPYTKTVTTSHDGSYQIAVPTYSNYKFSVTSSDYLSYEESLAAVSIPTTSVNYQTLNFSIDPKVGNIAGIVYLDSNNNGYYDAGDTTKIKDAHAKYMTGDFKVKTSYRGVPFSASVENNSTFTLSNIPAGSFYLTVDPPAANLDPAYAELNSTSWVEGANGNRIISVSASANSTINAVVTKTTYPTGSISGTIVDKETLNPISGATIKISSSSQNITTTSDISGYFNVTNLVYYNNETDTTEAFTVNITKTLYTNVQNTYTMARTPDASRNIYIYEKMAVVTGSLSGLVKDSQNNQPLVNVKVTVLGLVDPAGTGTILNTLTLADGTYLFSNKIKAGTYDLYYTKMDGSGQQIDQAYSTYTAYGIQVTSDSTEIKMVDAVYLSTNYSSLSGYIYLEANSISGYQAGQDKPLGDVSVTLTPNNMPSVSASTVISMSDGKYSFVNIQPGNYTLSFTSTAAEGYSASSTTLTIPASTAYTRDVQMQAKKGDLYGVVFYDENKNGIKDGTEKGIVGIDIAADAVFGLASTATPFLTGVDGEYEFKNMNAVTGTITATTNTAGANKYQKKTFSQTITAGQRTKVDIPMYRSSFAIKGRVIDDDTSQPIANVNVSINGYSYSTTTGADGRFTISDVAILLGSGTTNFEILFEAISLGYQNYTASSSSTGLDVTLGDTSLSKYLRKVRGRVINPDQEGVSGVSVNIVGETTVTAVTTDTQGYFTLESVSVDLNNQKQLQAVLTNYETTLRSFTLGAGTTTYNLSPDVTITPSYAEVSGTIIDELTGGPVYSPNFSISASITRGAQAYTSNADATGKFKIKEIPKGGPYDLAIQSSTGSNKHFADVLKSVTLTAGQKLDLGIVYIKLYTIAVKGTVYDSKVYDKAFTANDMTRAGVGGATVKARYKRSDGTYYQLSASSTLSGGSFEVQLPSLSFDFDISCSNYISQSYSNVNINTTGQASYDGLDFKIRPQTVAAYGKAYFDANQNGYVDAGDEPIFTANGGAFQSLVNTLIVSYDYHSFTFDVSVLSDSSFGVNDVPIAPDGLRRFTIYDRNLSNNIPASPWRDSSGNIDVSVSSGGTTPSSIDIAISPTESQYATFSGQVYDDKIWTEGYNLYNGSTGYSKYNTNYHISNVTIRVTSQSGFNQTFTSQSDGRFLIKVPGGNRYTLSYSAAGYSDTSESLVLAPTGVTTGVEARMYPKFGSLSGTVYYDNNVNGVNSEPTDYNYLHEASEPAVNSVIGHPTISSNWTGVTFNVMYSYRGLTFGTTSFNRSNSQYLIEKVPVGTYNNITVQDVSSLTNWVGVGSEYGSRSFMSQFYTLDGKTPASVTVSEGGTSSNINFAVMVWGGHISGIRMLTNGTDYTEGEFFLAAPTTLKQKMRGEDYWLALGGTLDKTDGLDIPRKYYLELFDVRDGGGSSGIKPMRFTDAQGVIKILSYPVGADPDVIIPPGSYVLSIAGDVDLSSSPLNPSGTGPNTDTWMAWYTSSNGYSYKYGQSAAGVNMAKDRCQQNIYYYQGAAGATGISIRAGQTHIIINN